jgi:hypothetical protein
MVRCQLAGMLFSGRSRHHPHLPLGIARVREQAVTVAANRARHAQQYVCRRYTSSRGAIQSAVSIGDVQQATSVPMSTTSLTTLAVWVTTARICSLSWRHATARWCDGSAEDALKWVSKSNYPLDMVSRLATSEWLVHAQRRWSRILFGIDAPYPRPRAPAMHGRERFPTVCRGHALGASYGGDGMYELFSFGADQSDRVFRQRAFRAWPGRRGPASHRESPDQSCSPH